MQTITRSRPVVREFWTLAAREMRRAPICPVFALQGSRAPELASVSRFASPTEKQAHFECEPGLAEAVQELPPARGAAANQVPIRPALGPWRLPAAEATLFGWLSASR